MNDELNEHKKIVQLTEYSERYTKFLDDIFLLLFKEMRYDGLNLNDQMSIYNTILVHLCSVWGTMNAITQAKVEKLLTKQNIDDSKAIVELEKQYGKQFDYYNEQMKKEQENAE